MNRFDTMFGGLIIGLIIPAAAICLFWWVSFLLGFDIRFWTITGIFVGVGLDLFMLRGLVTRFYSFSMTALVLIFCLYSIGIFGFFMGVPVFNVALGVVAGIYVGRRAKLTGVTRDLMRIQLRRAAVFSTIVLLVLCTASAVLALTDPYTGANLQGMLNLKSELTPADIWFLIIVGGTLLLVCQYSFLWLAGVAAYSRK